MPYPGPELMSRFSSDGEDSFVDFPPLLNATSRGKIQDLTGPDIVINGKVDVGVEDDSLGRG